MRSNRRPRVPGDSEALLRGVLRLGRRLRAERPEGGRSLAEIGLLSTLAGHGPLPAVRLAEHEGLQAQSLSRLITQLEDDGCIARHRSEHDRRALVIALTDAGRAALADDMRGRRRWLERALREAITPAERHALLVAAPAMLKLADHVPATSPPGTKRRGPRPARPGKPRPVRGW